MALLTKQRKKQQLLIGILALVVVITVGIVLYGSSRKVDTVVPLVGTGISSVPKVSIPKDLFLQEDFLELVPYTPLEIPTEIGKNNPFDF